MLILHVAKNIESCVTCLQLFLEKNQTDFSDENDYVQNFMNVCTSGKLNILENDLATELSKFNITEHDWRLVIFTEITNEVQRIQKFREAIGATDKWDVRKTIDDRIRKLRLQ